jgi:hypothetical protein
MKKPIPLDINKVEIPKEVMLSDIAGGIVFSLNQYKIYKKSEVPLGIKRFTIKHFDDLTHVTWYKELLKATDKMSDELLKKWFDIMPGCLFRAEMRAIMYERGLLEKPL